MAGSDLELYVYAFADPGLPRRFRAGGRSLRVITVGDVDVVVGATRERPRPTREALEEQHAAVVDLVARSPALLPARFGSFVTDRALRSMMMEHQPRLIESLTLVRDRHQMTVRVFDQRSAAQVPQDRAASGTAYLEARRA